MRTDDQRRSTNIEDRRGSGPARGGGRAAGAGASILLRLLMSRGGRRFILPLAVIGIIAVAYFGPEKVMSFVSALLGGGPAPQVTQLDPETEARFEQDAAAVLGSTEDVWSALYSAGGESYPEPTLVLFTGAANSACGYASAAMGPFY